MILDKYRDDKIAALGDNSEVDLLIGRLPKIKSKDTTFVYKKIKESLLIKK